MSLEDVGCGLAADWSNVGGCILDNFVDSIDWAERTWLASLDSHLDIVEEASDISIITNFENEGWTGWKSLCINILQSGASDGEEDVWGERSEIVECELQLMGMVWLSFGHLSDIKELRKFL